EKASEVKGEVEFQGLPFKEPKKPDQTKMAAQIAGQVGGMGLSTLTALLPAVNLEKVLDEWKAYEEARKEYQAKKDEYLAKMKRNADQARGIDFKTLESAAYDAGLRQLYKDQFVKVRGQFMPSPGGNPRMFNLVRLQIKCCAADVVPLRVFLYCEDEITDI